jgi:hypothetical protein
MQHESPGPPFHPLQSEVSFVPWVRHAKRGARPLQHSTALWLLPSILCSQMPHSDADLQDSMHPLC